MKLHPDFSSSQEGYQTELSYSMHWMWERVLHFFTQGIFATCTSGKVQSCSWEEGVKLGTDNPLRPAVGMWCDLRPARPLWYKRTMNGRFNKSVKSARESYDMQRRVQKGGMKREIKHKSLFLRYAVQTLYHFCFGGHYDWRTSTSDSKALMGLCVVSRSFISESNHHRASPWV